MSKSHNDQLTKEDVKQVVSEAVGDLASMVKKDFDDVCTTIQEAEERTKRHFDVVAENI